MRVVTDERSAAASPVTPPAATLLPDASASVNVWPMVLAGTAGGVVLFTASLALSTRTGMWLDEAQTLSISRLPLTDLLDALKRDGSPPLYYLLLHGWTAVAGTSEVAVRSLSALFAVGAVALVPFAAARLDGRRSAATAALLLATAPFMHRYATEARMYTLVVLLAVAGFLAVRAALEQPNVALLTVVAVITGLLMLTHYWTMFLLFVVAGVVAQKARGPEGWPARRALVAMGVGSLLFVPWVPTFAFHLRHTGAPWSAAPGAWMFEASLQALAGGRGRIGLLGFVYLALFALGLFGRPLPGGRIELDLRGRAGARPLAVVVVATLALALLVSNLTDSAFAPRYASVVLVPFVLVAACGLAVVRDQRILVVLVAVVVGMGLLRSADEASAPRTQARGIASAIDARAQAGDVVAFCPDQLAPAVVRLVSAEVTTAAFPPGGPVERVDWVDYRERVAASGSQDFAASLDRRAGGANVWLAWAPGYHSLGRKCDLVLQALRRLRPSGTRQLAKDITAYEQASLWRFPPTINQ